MAFKTFSSIVRNHVSQPLLIFEDWLGWSSLYSKIIDELWAKFSWKRLISKKLLSSANFKWMRIHSPLTSLNKHSVSKLRIKDHKFCFERFSMTLFSSVRPKKKCRSRQFDPLLMLKKPENFSTSNNLWPFSALINVSFLGLQVIKNECFSFFFFFFSRRIKA